MKETLLTGWHFMRWLRLGIGLTIAVQSIISREPIAGVIAALFLFQAVTNTGCGANGCAVPTTRSRANKVENVEFEEVK
jgi:hypothetical protein